MSIDACGRRRPRSDFEAGWRCALSTMMRSMASASDGPLLCLAREPTVRVGGVLHALGTREAALLAWLAIEGPTSRADLASLLWPDSDAEAARSALRQRIFQLRRIAGGALVVGTQTLALAEGVTHDLDGADSVLGDRSSALGASFDAWLDSQRSARRSRLHRLLVERAERAEAAGELGEAIGHARELLARDLLSEDAHRRLIRLLYLAGERPQALLAFDRCEQLLKDEVGVSPSPETLALLQTIVRAESARRPEAPAQAEALVPAAVLRPPLRVGRAHAWDLLAAPRGQGAARARVVFGEPGMGKSRLLADLVLATNATTPRVVLATARPGDARVPYALAARLLRGVLAGYPVEPGAEQRTRLARIVPELDPSAAASPAGSRAGLITAGAALLETAAGCGLTGIVVDDLQFADAASVEWLQALVAAGSRLDWTLAMRPHELRAPARQWIDSLQQNAAVETVTLEPLSKPEVGVLLESLGLQGLELDAERIDSLQRRTGGNPLYVLETVKVMLAARSQAAGGESDGAPWPAAPNVVRLIQQRLRRLSPLARSVARCAAIAGQDHDVWLAAQVLGKRAVELADAWAELEAAHVLRADGQFAHDLIADAALASVPAAIRAPLHAEVARWLEAHAGEPGRVAEHWLAAGMAIQAAPWLVATAERALDAYRADEAAPRFEQASKIYAAAGQRRQAFEALFRTAVAHTQHDYGEVPAAIHETLLDSAEDEGQLAMASLFLVARLVGELRYDEAIATARRAAEQAHAAGLSEIEAELRFALTIIHWERRQLDDTVREAERTIELLRDPGERRWLRWTSTQLHATYCLGLVLGVSGRYDESEFRLLDVQRTAARAGDEVLARIVAYARSGFALDRGDHGRALSLSDAAMATVERLAIADGGVVRVMARHAHLLALDGQLGAALELHERAARVYGEMPTRHLAPAVQKALLQHSLGRYDLGKAGLVELERRLQPDATLVWLELRAARLAMGEGDGAAEVLAEASRHQDVAVRVGAVCKAALAADAAVALPVVEGELEKTGALGAKGMALALAARRAALLHALGRADDAAGAALAAWRSFEAGTCCQDLMLPDFAALLCPALARSHPDLARQIAARARRWMGDAAATLPDAWRENYLARAPALRGLYAAEAASASTG